MVNLMLHVHVCLFQLYWMRMSEPNPITVGTYVYSPDTRFSVTKDHTSTHWDLRIRNVKFEDAGVYFCAVSSGEGREKHRRLIKLNVKGPYRVKPLVSFNVQLSLIIMTDITQPDTQIQNDNVI